MTDEEFRKFLDDDNYIDDAENRAYDQYRSAVLASTFEENVRRNDVIGTNKYALTYAEQRTYNAVRSEAIAVARARDNRNWQFAQSLVR